MTAQARPDELIRILRAEFVTKLGGVPGGGAGTCVIFTCGAVGWRGTAGVISKTLVHETAFQLDTYGNARGAYAIDFQKESSRFPQVIDVAAGEFSVILSGRNNVIGPTAQECSIRGDFNEITDSYSVYIVGDYNYYIDDCSNVSILGSSNGDITDCYYVVLMGCWSGDIENVFGLVVFGEGNEVTYDCTYSGMLGLGNQLWGENWGVYLLGEACRTYSVPGGTFPERNYFSILHGLQSYAENVSYNFLFGRLCKSYNTQVLDGLFYDGRMVLSGDEPNSYQAEHGNDLLGGYNQISWFSQNEYITNWPSAWTTSGIQFPIILDSMWGFIAYISGTEGDCANVFRWKIEGAIKNAGGVTTLLWSNVSNQYRDVATKEWRVIADNVNDRLVFQFRDTAGPDATICNTQFSIQTIEVGYD